MLIGFAAETENLLDNARAKLAKKAVDAIVLNDVSRLEIGFNSDRNEVTIVTPTDTIPLPEASKLDVAQKILEAALRIRREKATCHRSVDLRCTLEPPAHDSRSQFTSRTPPVLSRAGDRSALSPRYEFGSRIAGRKGATGNRNGSRCRIGLSARIGRHCEWRPRRSTSRNPRRYRPQLPALQAGEAWPQADRLRNRRPSCRADVHRRRPRCGRRRAGAAVRRDAPDNCSTT